MSVGQHPESAAGATRLSYKKIGMGGYIPILPKSGIAHNGGHICRIGIRPFIRGWLMHDIPRGYEIYEKVSVYSGSDFF